MVPGPRKPHSMAYVFECWRCRRKPGGRERWVHAARSLFQKRMLPRLCRLRPARAEADADPVLRFVVRIFDSCVIEREFCRRDGKLRVTIKPLQTVRRKIIFRNPIGNFPAALRVEQRWRRKLVICPMPVSRPGFLSKSIDAFANAGDRTEAGNDDASSVHAVTGLALPRRTRFIQRNVLFATWPMKKSPMIGSAIGARAGMRNRSSCEISTATP